MTKTFRFALLALPWIGMLVFGLLYFGTRVELAVADHYSEVSFRSLSQSNELLMTYTKSRREHESDIEAFETLNWISDDQYDGKYSPWLRTELGLVQFDESGFMIKICLNTGELNRPDCPPQL